MNQQTELPVLIKRHSSMLSICLNRPHFLNVLTLDMVRMIRRAFDQASEDERIRFVMLYGSGERAFCAGADIRSLYEAAKAGKIERIEEFLQEEYDLDLKIHRFSKPVVVLAHGITMGGGLGFSSGADLVVVTEQTRMAMPETRIGFIPDVGATGWLFLKCPPGYPEYLGLTGYEMKGPDCVRLGLATQMIDSVSLPGVKQQLENFSGEIAQGRTEGAEHLRSALSSFFNKSIPTNPEMDAWVAEHFDGKTSVQEILGSLKACSLQNDLCQDVFSSVSERSPTALVLTLHLLRKNQNRPLEEVFAREARGAHFMVSQPDFQEGVRARIIEKDDQPRWHPSAIDEVPRIEIDGCQYLMMFLKKRTEKITGKGAGRTR
jgi:enoyl-CoA hydratase